MVVRREPFCDFLYCCCNGCSLINDATPKFCAGMPKSKLYSRPFMHLLHLLLWWVPSDWWRDPNFCAGMPKSDCAGSPLATLDYHMWSFVLHTKVNSWDQKLFIWTFMFKNYLRQYLVYQSDLLTFAFLKQFVIEDWNL